MKLYSLNSNTKIYCLILVIFIIWLSLVEVILRNGKNKFSYHFSIPNSVVVNTIDPILGYRIKPGIYESPAFTKGSDNLNIHILEDGSRRTSANNNHHLEEIALYGCSFTFGSALSDSQTIAWKLQEKHSARQFKNYGTPGYSTYQILLQLKQNLAKKTAPKIVIYNYIQHHEIRNVAPNHWRFSLAIPLPFVSLTKDGELVPRYSKRFTKLPFSNKLYSIMAIEGWYKRLLSPFQDTDPTHMRLATTKLIQELHTVSQKAGAEFYLVMLDAKTETTQIYQNLSNSLGINVVDCTHPIFSQFYSPADGPSAANYKHPDLNRLTLPVDRHPNEIMNDYWAECINTKIKL